MQKQQQQGEGEGEGEEKTTESIMVANMKYPYGSFRGEEYEVAIAPDDVKSQSTIKGFCRSGKTTASTSAATLASSESQMLLDRYFKIHEEYDMIDEHNKRVCLKESPLWTFLGFASNPLASSESLSNNRNNAAADMRLAMLSNFSTAYNIVSISLALHIMGNIYELDATDKSLCSSALIAGMIFGQLLGGTLGDVLGRHLAMALVMCLQVGAALGSAFALSIGTYSIFSVLAVWRFILGIGAGGVYPLAATMTAESSHEPEERGKTVALTFSMQGVGYLVVPITAWILVSILGESSDLAWRLLLGFGCAPGAWLTIVRVTRQITIQQKRNEADIETGLHMQSMKQLEVDTTQITTLRTAPLSVWDAIRLEKNLVRKLMGTAVCWFIFDVLFYGNTLFQPLVLSSAFGAAETVEKAARDTSLIALMALPGYIMSVAAVGRQSPRYIQMQGFMLMGILYGVIGYFFDVLAGERWVLLTLYGSTFFFSNYGPNSTTFMLPSITFSKACRSTLNGVCAASGKAGALLGSLVFVEAAAHFGSATVMMVCAVLSLLGVILTCCFVDEAIETGRFETKETVLQQHMNVEERRLIEQKIHKTPMGVVVSRPSIFDFGVEHGVVFDE